jgi:hypothetical protein
MTSHFALEALLSSVRDWWRRHNELGSIDPKELERVAGELGMSTGTLEDLVARGADAADHLYERLDALGLSQTDVERAAQDVLRDLQPTCACRDEKGRCEKDLRDDPAGAVWKDYCRNAATLNALVRLKEGCGVPHGSIEALRPKNDGGRNIPSGHARAWLALNLRQIKDSFDWLCQIGPVTCKEGVP